MWPNVASRDGGVVTAVVRWRRGMGAWSKCGDGGRGVASVVMGGEWGGPACRPGRGS